MSNVQYLIEWTIKDGGLEGFMSLGKAAIDATKSGEPGTVGYEWYFNADKTKCYLSERFTDSDALLAHLTNVGPVLPKFFEVSEITRFEAFGDLSETAVGALSELNVACHPRWDGFSR